MGDLGILILVLHIHIMTLLNLGIRDSFKNLSKVKAMAFMLGLNISLSAGASAETNQATVSIDATLLREIDGQSELNRRQYFNVHFEPYNIEEVPMRDYLFDTLDVFGGRSFNFGWYMNRVKEDSARPGFWDARTLTNRRNRNRQAWINDGSPNSDPDSDSVIVGHLRELYPYAEDITRARNDGGFRTRNHDALADFATRYIEGFFPQPAYFEVVNEVDVKINQANTSWENVSALHVKIARAFKAAGLDTKVIGAAYAWPQFERNNFRVWNDAGKKFIDLAGGDLDALSYHVYDREGGNLEAILDLVENYSTLKYGEVIPYLLTEGAASEKDFPANIAQERYRVLKVNNAMMMQLMERGERMEKWIPFNTLTAFRKDRTVEWTSGLRDWNPSAQRWEWTDIVKLYELWQGVKGRRCYVASSDPDVLTQGFLDGRTLHVAIHNISDGQANVQLSRLTGGAAVNRAAISRLGFTNGQIRYQKNGPLGANANSLTLSGGETVIVRYTLASNPAVRATVRELTHYGNKVVQPIVANRNLNININGVPTGSKSYARLRFGLGNVSNDSLNPQVFVNGTRVNYSRDLFGKESYDFKTREVNVPVSLINSSNTIRFVFPRTGGHLSTAVLIVGRGPEVSSGPNQEFRAGIVISLKGSNGKYVSSENGVGGMNCNRNSVAGWERFEVGSGANGTFTFKNRGRYVSSENGNGAITCNRAAVGDWERFRVTVNGDVITLRGSHGEYVSSENGAINMTCNRTSAQSWERFTWKIE